MKHLPLTLSACIALVAIALVPVALGQNYERPQPKPYKPVPSQGIIKVQVAGLAFRPSVIRVNAGKPVQVQLRNGGAHPHNIVFDLPSVDPRISRNVAPGRSGTVTFRAPLKKGTYRYFCPVGNHAKLGMVGKLIVQ